MIYLIDDDDIQNIINHKIIQLVDSNITIQTFSGAQAALQALEETKKLPKLIFLDINMPRMNGWDFLEIYEQTDIGVPVYILTSSINNMDRERSVGYSSVRGFLSKPLSAESVRAIILQHK
jgi:CheY-like chemotaxis protein